MLTRDDLSSTPIDFNLYQKEKDYLQHISLSRIFSRIGSEIIFRGGTSLQKCFGLDRFSEDLDFTASENFSRERIKRALNEVGRFYPTSLSESENIGSVSFKMKIEGPLFHGPLSMQTIRIEISLREKVSLHPLNRIITPLYSDLQPYMVVFMDPKEIMSEKIRALMTRTKARDLYDTYFLVRKNVKLDTQLVAKKLEYYSVIFDQTVLLERAARLKTQWEKELRGLVRIVPDFDTVISTLKDFVSE